VPECRKIKNGGLDQYGAECFGRLILATNRRSVGLKRFDSYCYSYDYYAVRALDPVIFLHPANTPVIPSQFWDHTPNCQSTYTADLTEHLPAVKLCKIHIDQLLFYWQSQISIYSCVSKFCLKFGNFA